MLRVTGEIVRFERKSWTMSADAANPARSGITRKARVLVGKADFVDVTYPEAMPEPREGDLVDLAVIAGARNGVVRITVAGPWDQLVKTSVPAAPVAAVKSA